MNLSENSVWRTILHVHQSQMQSFHLSWSNRKLDTSTRSYQLQVQTPSSSAFIQLSRVLPSHDVSISAQPPASRLWVESAADRKHFARQAAPHYELLLAGTYVSNSNFYPQQATSSDISVFLTFYSQSLLIETLVAYT